MAVSHSPKIVMLGGGTGTFTVLSSLKYYVQDITAVVNMSDDGGSTGVLRDEFGVLPPGDIRQSLVALSSSPQQLRDLFNYRFPEGAFVGHSFGNLFLTVLDQTTGSFREAVRVAGEILAITGQVVPVTTDNVRLHLRLPDGTVVEGESNILESNFQTTTEPELFLSPHAQLNPDAAKAIAAADIIIIGPGNVYSSLVPILLVDGVPEALAAAKAKTVYVSNLVTKPGQTDGYQVHDFAETFNHFLGGSLIDYVIYNTAKPDPSVLRRYAQVGELWVGYDQQRLDTAPYVAIGAPLIARSKAKQSPNDHLVRRTLIRHDSDVLARIIMRIFFS